jgi:hypothetical protein
MFNASGQSPNGIVSSVQQVLLALRSSSQEAARVCSWVVAQSSADLEAIGFSAADTATLQSTCGNIMSLLNAASGGAPAPELDYFANALDLLGPNR